MFTAFYKMEAWMFIPMAGRVKVEFKNVIFNVTVNLDQSNGYLNPVLKKVHLHLDESNIYTDGFLRQWQFRQTFNFFKTILQDAVNRFGTRLFNQVLPVVSQTFLNHQQRQFSFNFD